MQTHTAPHPPSPFQSDSSGGTKKASLRHKGSLNPRVTSSKKGLLPSSRNATQETPSTRALPKTNPWQQRLLADEAGMSLTAFATAIPCPRPDPSVGEPVWESN